MHNVNVQFCNQNITSGTCFDSSINGLPDDELQKIEAYRRCVALIVILQIDILHLFVIIRQCIVKRNSVNRLMGMGLGEIIRKITCSCEGYVLVLVILLFCY